jgi:hypothetical protein
MALTSVVAVAPVGWLWLSRHGGYGSTGCAKNVVLTRFSCSVTSHWQRWLHLHWQ